MKSDWLGGRESTRTAGFGEGEGVGEDRGLGGADEGLGVGAWATRLSASLIDELNPWRKMTASGWRPDAVPHPSTRRTPLTANER